MIGFPWIVLALALGTAAAFALEALMDWIDGRWPVGPGLPDDDEMH